MSVSINNLFNYSRSLPVPFDTMTNKKVKVASMYGAKTESTLCGSVIKAVHAMCRCMNGTGEGAVGQIDTNKSVAEYKSSIGPDAYHLVVFDAASGSALASVYDKNTELIEQYVAHPSQRDGAAIFFALMPFLMSDVEFDETFQEYYDQFIAGYPDMATLNSWNRSTSYACNLKITHLGLSPEVVDKLFDMIQTQEFFDAMDECKWEFAAKHNYLWQAGMNGRSGGYLVLYQGEKRPSGYKSYCANCGQKNYQLAADGNCTCGVCGRPTRVNFSQTHIQVVTYPGRGTDDGEDFEDWSMHALRERVKLVQELDQLADRMVELALRLTREAQVIEEEYFIPQTRKVLVTTP